MFYERISSVFVIATATTDIYTLSLHDALPIYSTPDIVTTVAKSAAAKVSSRQSATPRTRRKNGRRSEEHTSELQSRQYLVCRLLLEKKKQRNRHRTIQHTLYNDFPQPCRTKRD